VNSHFEDCLADGLTVTEIAESRGAQPRKDPGFADGIP
jgi:hypothetical protein